MGFKLYNKVNMQVAGVFFTNEVSLNDALSSSGWDEKLTLVKTALFLVVFKNYGNLKF